MKFRNIHPGMQPPQYEVSENGVVLGSVIKISTPYIQFGTLNSWRPYLPDGTRIEETFGTRGAAAEYLKAKAV
jgi:hypothetical protein